jgi:hypothetical protein
MKPTMTKIVRTFDEIFTALERNIDRASGKPRLRGAFVEFADGIGVGVDDVAKAIRGRPMIVPPALLAKLDLAPRSSTTAVADALMVLFNAPIVQTAEEQAEEEVQALGLSEIVEQANTENPGLPQLPVAYPKETRTKH